ncbi:MAG: hypothetical protein ACI9DM_000468 [Cyclobacteriaceae bacterium]
MRLFDFFSNHHSGLGAFSEQGQITAQSFLN